MDAVTVANGTVRLVLACGGAQAIDRRNAGMQPRAAETPNAPNAPRHRRVWCMVHPLDSCLRKSLSPRSVASAPPSASKVDSGRLFVQPSSHPSLLLSLLFTFSLCATLGHW